MKNLPEKETVPEVEVSLPQASVHAPKKDLDAAFDFINSYADEDGQITDIDIRAVRRKVDWHIVPIMFLCYLAQSLDKTNLNYAAVMGIKTDLKLQGNDYSNISTAFFVAYLIAELWNGYALLKIPAAKWLGGNIVVWGIATTCTAAATNYTTLIITRVFLGLCEAAIAPSLMHISSQWYSKSEQGSRFALWFCGAGLSQIVGSLMSYGLQHVNNPNFTGWKSMFLVLGLLTIIVGITTYVFVPDSPMSASFLTRAEKIVLLNHVSENRTGIENHGFKPAQIKELFADVQLWLLTLLALLTSLSSGFVLTYSSTIINNFGYSAPISALLGIPGGVVSLLANLISGFGIRYFSHRWAWIVICCLFGLIGGCFMSYLPSSNRAGLLVGIYLVNTMTATLILVFQWVTVNFAGHTKKVVAKAWIAGMVAVGGLISPQMFQAHDAPDYHPAKVAQFATQAASIAVCVVLLSYYIWQNKRKDSERMAHESEGGDIQETLDLWADQTDKENLSFRYSY